MKYRPEINGIRTLAVVPVVFFHAGFQQFSGGFIGVDIFFVISGFLITGIIMDEIEAGNFSILRFYERRARRILPALFFIMIACTPLAWAWMMPEDLINFGQSLVAVSLFISNFLFWRESGYFDTSAELKPLLHTWSLSIEEQYYVIFPVLLLLGWRWLSRKGLFVLIAAVAVVSLGLAEWGSRIKPDATFYLLHTRAWELLAGSLTSFIATRRSVPGSSLWAGVGLAMVVASIFVFDGSVRLPSAYTLLPVLGTCLLLLFAKAGTLTARILSLKPMVGLGLVSYSAYLWHQPLLAFARIRSLHEPSPWLMGGLAVLSFVLGYLTWRYVESPFRNSGANPARIAPSRAGIFAISLAGLSGFVLIGASLHVAKGAPGRFQPEALAFIDAVNDRNPRRPTCHYIVDEGAMLPALPNPACVFGAGENKPRALLLGDSHGDALAYENAMTLEATGWQVEQATVSGCNPFPGFRKIGRDCHTANLKLLEYAKSGNFDLIVLTFRPQPMLFSDGYDNGEGGIESDNFRPVIFDTDYLGLSTYAETLEILEALYTKGLEQYLATNAAVLVFYPIPEAGWNVPMMAAKTVIYEGISQPDLSTSNEKFILRNAPFISILDKVKNSRLFRIRPDKYICGKSIDPKFDGRCINTVGSTALYYDDDHLSNAGVRFLAPALEAALADIQTRFLRTGAMN